VVVSHCGRAASRLSLCGCPPRTPHWRMGEVAGLPPQLRRGMAVQTGRGARDSGMLHWRWWAAVSLFGVPAISASVSRHLEMAARQATRWGGRWSGYVVCRDRARARGSHWPGRHGGGCSRGRVPICKMRLRGDCGAGWRGGAQWVGFSNCAKRRCACAHWPPLKPLAGRPPPRADLTLTPAGHCALGSHEGGADVS